MRLPTATAGGAGQPASLPRTVPVGEPLVGVSLVGVSLSMADVREGGGCAACCVWMRWAPGRVRGRPRRGWSGLCPPGGAAREELRLVALEWLPGDRLGVARPVAGGRSGDRGAYGRRALQVQFDLPVVGRPGLGLRARHWSRVYGPRAAVFTGASALRAWRPPARLRASAWEPGDEVLWRGGGSCRPCGPVPGHCGLHGCPPRGLQSCADVREARLPLALRGHPFAAASSRASATAALTAARRTRLFSRRLA